MDLNTLITEEGTILSAFHKACDRHAERTALIFLGTRFTYSQLRDFVCRFAASSTELGIGFNDRVLIYLPNCPQWLIAYLGLQEIGAVPVPISPIYTPRELSYLINHSGSETILCADTNFGYVKEVFPVTHLKRIITTNIADLLPLWKRAFGRIFDKVSTGSVSRDRGVTFFKKTIRYTATRLPETEFNLRTHLAHILYTGGTTGHPKGVPHTHLELLSGIVGIRETYRSFINESEHTLIMPLNLFHMFSQDMVFAIGLHLGNTVVISPKPNTDAVLATIQDYRGTLLTGVPTLYRQILENDRLEFYDLGSLKYCWSAGDVLPLEVASRWREKTGVPIHQVYGSTETVCISVSPLANEPLPGTVGMLLPTRQARVVDSETSAAVSSGAGGELLVSSDYSYVAGGYWNNPHETSQTYVTLDRKIWCKTGDYVKMTPDKQIEFIDRRADLIKHKGLRVSASRVESVIQDHPAVMAACVVGTPDPLAGENVKAFVILKEDARGITSYDLIKHCRERLLPYEVPDYIEFRDMLPKSKVGKLLRREIRDKERRKTTPS